MPSSTASSSRASLSCATRSTSGWTRWTSCASGSTTSGPRAGPRRAVATLSGRDLLLGHRLRQLRDLLLEELRHALLLATNAAGELGRLLVVHGLRERLDARVGRDLLELVVVLGLRVLEHLLGLAGAANRVQRSLRRGHGLAGHGRERGSRLDDRRRARAHRAGLRLAAELADARLQLATMSLRFLQMLTEALLVRRPRPLLVRRPRCHGDVSLEGGLELLLFAVRLVEVLDQLRVPGVRIRHLS